MAEIVVTDQLILAIFKLGPAIKLKLVQDLWDDLASNPTDVPVHDWQIKEVQRRKQKLAEDPSAAISWDEFDRRMRNTVAAELVDSPRMSGWKA